MNIKIKENDELDQATQYFTTLIEEAARYSTPAPPDKTNNAYNIPLHIRELVTEKRRARNRWQNSRNNYDRTIYNRLKRRLHNTLANTRNISFEQYITSLSKDEYTYNLESY
jgi:RNA polymerase-interacting CarD/CdnL/TRCF family regulator